MKLTIMVLALLLVSGMAYADNLGTEVVAVGESVVENVELSLLGGTVGWGAGAYWPLYELPKLNATLGPFLAIATEAAAAGAGARFDVSIPVLESFVDFVGIGAQHKHGSTTTAIFVGKTL